MNSRGINLGNRRARRSSISVSSARLLDAHANRGRLGSTHASACATGNERPRGHIYELRLMPVHVRANTKGRSTVTCEHWAIQSPTKSPRRALVDRLLLLDTTAALCVPFGPVAMAKAASADGRGKTARRGILPGSARRRNEPRHAHPTFRAASAVRAAFAFKNHPRRPSVLTL